MKHDVIIIGAGAAGMMCAIEAGKNGRNALLIEHSKSVGEKIRISGGGRCNFTNLNASPANFLSNNPHFCKSALSQYTQYDFIELVRKHNISYHEKTLGQLFCDNSSKEIIKLLLDECQKANVNISLNTSVKEITKKGSIYELVSNNDEILQSNSVVIATGGPSIPKIGATTWGHEIAKQFGHSIIELRAALVPFTLDSNILSSLKELSGISLNVIASCNGQSFREGMLFTHRGLSGPAILQISSYWKNGDKILVNLSPDIDIYEKLIETRQKSPKKDIQSLLTTILPKRLASHICIQNGFKGQLSDISNANFSKIANSIHKWEVIPNGTEGYKTAEVTIGGVNTDELSSKTMESKKSSGLFFIGEVVDVTGHLGGYNFQWAWSSGYVAGQYA